MGMDEFARKVYEAYGLEPSRLMAPQKGYRNTNLAGRLPDGRWVNLVVYKAEPGSLELVRRTNDVGEYLWAKSLPVRYPIDRRILVLDKSGIRYSRYASLYNYLPGHTIPWEAYTMDHIKVLGMALSNLHAGLRDYAGSGLPAVHQIYTNYLKRMIRYFSDTGVGRAMSRTLKINPPLDACRQLLDLTVMTGALDGQQALHMDFVRGNILFDSDLKDRPDLAVGSTSICGILDFEKAAVGHPLYDIARTLAFLLVDCKYKIPDKIRKYFLYSGYAKRGAAVLPDLNQLERLLDLFLIYDFYKFLRHNPYEDLQDNEHYIRTLTILKQRSLLTSLRK